MKKVSSSICLFIWLMVGMGCNNGDVEMPYADAKIIGKWKMIGAYISSGGPQYWVEVADGEEIEFFSNGSFISNKYSDCKNGDFILIEETLSLEFKCMDFEAGIENEEGVITFKIEFDNEGFLLSPTSVICIEGCSYKYERMNQ